MSDLAECLDAALPAVCVSTCLFTEHRQVKHLTLKKLRSDISRLQLLGGVHSLHCRPCFAPVNAKQLQCLKCS